ncbi:GDSL-type esterase/lipase family protein [Protaetiibacter intestinalis]|uniref:GDSL-type esterase/lipase family protein n=1 Tax=Protaetiibacter intestinalis TaxID=2419774 RepID=UPI0013008E54|nr:GDSL-type esterase/lipase family protein [Protaetiibacter intestinalis]
MALSACTPETAGTRPVVVDEPSPVGPTRPAIIDEVEQILVLGDSVTLGVNACTREERICGAASWATGGSDVDSLAVRATAQNPGAVVSALARDGARVSTALGNLDTILAEHAQLVVVFLGANDACAPSLDEMTDIATFRDQYGRLLNALHADSDPAILAVLVPDLENVWEQGHGTPQALRAWGSTPACRSLLGDADDTGATASGRRAAVSTRVDEYNAAIAELCGLLPKCRTDGGVVHDHPFDSGELSTVDYFHPSEAGQRVIASLVWSALAELPTANG